MGSGQKRTSASHKQRPSVVVQGELCLTDLPDGVREAFLEHMAEAIAAATLADGLVDGPRRGSGADRQRDPDPSCGERQPATQHSRRLPSKEA